MHKIWKKPKSEISVVGIGAMESIYAGFLSEAGNEVWVTDTKHRYIKAIRDNGLRLAGVVETM